MFLSKATIYRPLTIEWMIRLFPGLMNNACCQAVHLPSTAGLLEEKCHWRVCCSISKIWMIWRNNCILYGEEKVILHELCSFGQKQRKGKLVQFSVFQIFPFSFLPFTFPIPVHFVVTQPTGAWTYKVQLQLYTSFLPLNPCLEASLHFHLSPNHSSFPVSFQK